VRQARLAQASKGQEMGLRLDALKGSKQMGQDMFEFENECMKALMRENAEKKCNQFFVINTKKHLTSDETWWLLI